MDHPSLLGSLNRTVVLSMVVAACLLGAITIAYKAAQADVNELMAHIRAHNEEVAAEKAAYEKAEAAHFANLAQIAAGHKGKWVLVQLEKTHEHSRHNTALKSEIIDTYKECDTKARSGSYRGACTPHGETTLENWRYAFNG